jgi:hypothetical protein
VIARIEPPRDPERALRDAGLEPRPWSAAPGAHFGVHAHERTKRLFVLRGSIAFNGAPLQAPAGIRIPAGFEHSADVGDDGVECVEAFE